MKKAQIALEFLVIISLVLFVFIGFVYVLDQQVSGIGMTEDRIAMNNLGERIRNEIMLARGVHANYIRYFEIPERLNGKNYSIVLLDPEDIWKYGIRINISGYGRSEFFSLPVDVKGQFVDVEKDFLDYCITKGENNKIAVSRNQVGLDYSCYPLGRFDEEMQLNAEGILEAGTGDEFSLYLEANCINNLQTASFEINHSGFEYVDFRQAWSHEPVSGEAPYQIYGDFMFEGDEPENKAFIDADSCGTGCTRITISHAGIDGPTGSDALAELIFRAVSARERKLSIGDVDLVDAQIRDIPPSKQDVEVTIV